MFDFIIVGAGSAGCVLANRLTEDRKARVLLVEAGTTSRNPWMKIPAGTARLYSDASVNWCYYTEEEPGLNNRRVYCPRGKTVGGSSSINGLVYMRGVPRDYDSWRQLGNAGWSWDEVLPYFRKSECQERGSDPYHGTTGELHVSDLADPHAASRAFVAAGQAVGLPLNTDFNGARQDGIGYVQYNIKRGMRHSAASAFLDPARGRPNLKIETGALALRILFGDGQARGIEYRRADRVDQALGGEIILAGGAINSPQVLMLSGIGPAEELKSLGLTVVRDLPGVGRNLHDHVYAHYLSNVDPSFSINKLVLHAASATTSWRLLPEVMQFALRRTGILTSAAAQVAAFVRSNPRVQSPDLQIQFRPFSMIITKEGRFVAEPRPAVTASCSHIRPRSRGSVTLRSPDPLDAPKILFNYLREDEDQRTMMEGVKIVRSIFGASPMKEHVIAETMPGPECRSDNEILGYLRQHAQAMYHPVGTCKMGSDPLGVVDDRLRVKGIARLRVVDASIMPVIISGNTNAPTIMIAEKGADMIREDARRAMVA